LQIAAHGVTMSDDGNDNAELPTGFGIRCGARSFSTAKRNPALHLTGLRPA